MRPAPFRDNLSGVLYLQAIPLVSFSHADGREITQTLD
jgi:hypothetical protein